MKQAAITLVVGVLLAGCSGTVPTENNPVEAAAADSTWQSLSVEASPEGTAAAFVWEPDAALGLTGHGNGIVVDPTRSTNPENITAWAILFFTPGRDALVLEGALVEGSHQEWTVPGGEPSWIPTSVDLQVMPLGEAPPGSPWNTRFGVTLGPIPSDERYVGKTVGSLRNDTARVVVVAAVGEPGATLDVSFRPSSAAIDRGLDFTMRARAAGQPAAALAEIGRTEGFELAFFARTSSTFGQSYWLTGEQEPWHETLPAGERSQVPGGMRTEALEIRRESRSGWALLAVREDSGTGIAETTYEGHAFGVRADGHVIMSTGAVWSCTVSLCDRDLYHDATVTAEGTGDIEWRIERTSVANPTFADSLHFVYIWIGGGLENLAGIPGESVFVDWTYP